MKKIIKIKVLPCSSRNEFIKLAENEFKVKLTASPIDGEANKKLLNLLNKEWKIPKSKIKIVRGLTSKNKIIEII